MLIAYSNEVLLDVSKCRKQFELAPPLEQREVMNASEKKSPWACTILASVIARGFFEITHSSFALIGPDRDFCSHCCINRAANPAPKWEKSNCFS
jgi:hypothetical protein